MPTRTRKIRHQWPTTSAPVRSRFAGTARPRRTCIVVTYRDYTRRQYRVPRVELVAAAPADSSDVKYPPEMCVFRRGPPRERFASCRHVPYVHRELATGRYDGNRTSTTRSERIDPGRCDCDAFTRYTSTTVGHFNGWPLAHASITKLYAQTRHAVQQWRGCGRGRAWSMM